MITRQLLGGGGDHENVWDNVHGRYHCNEKEREREREREREIKVASNTLRGYVSK